MNRALKDRSSVLEKRFLTRLSTPKKIILQDVTSRPNDENIVEKSFFNDTNTSDIVIQS